MIRITQIKIPVTDKKTKIENKICDTLHIKTDQLINYKIVRRSIEARKHETLSYVYTVNAEIKNEKNVLKRSKNRNVSKFTETKYIFPEPGKEMPKYRPVIIGFGPAGLFCAYFLAINGYRPVIFERGGKVEERSEAVKRFWESGILDKESNVQFGEGGAGTFSDGKLNTGVNDKSGRNNAVLELFVKYGAPEDILYDAKPHIGTDILHKVIKNIREAIISFGGTFYFNTKVDELIIKDGNISAVNTGDKTYETDVCVLAIGHSARDTMLMLHRKSVKMEAKSFAVGVRIQHSQKFINDSQWGPDAPKELGAAPYKLTAQLPDGRGIYTFCMCPGGYVVNASSEAGGLCVNGMSYSGRDSGNANSAVIVTVRPEDYLEYKTHEIPEELSAISFQRDLEKRAFKAANGKIPVQRYQDFKENKASVSSELEPCTKGSWEYSNLRNIFPDFLASDLETGIEELGKKLKDFDTPEALMMGVESRTSSPVRILRDDSFQCNIRGLYSCGEGAGYAGGITSAAIDGLRTAEAIVRNYKKSC